MTQLPWTHQLIILNLSEAKPVETREFYLLAAIKEHWSKRELERQIRAGAVLRSTGLPKKVSPAVTQIHPTAIDEFKNAYNVESSRARAAPRLPHVQHQRAPEDEARAVWGGRQPVEEANHRVVLEQLLERPLRRARVILETSLHRGRACSAHTEKQTAFAVSAGLLSLYWLVQGYGYQITSAGAS